MNILIIILAVIAGFVAFLFIAAVFTKKEYFVQREAIINSPLATVFDYLKHIKNQDYYNKWVMTDPEMKKIYKGTDGTVGFIYGWNGNKKAGEGEQEITAIVEGKRLDTEVRFVRPFVSTAFGVMTTESVSDNQTKIIWSNTSKMKVPLNLFASNIEKMLGQDMDVTFGNLKRILEK